MIQFLSNLKNIFDFRIRKLTKFSRKNYVEKNEDKTDLFKINKLKKREEELVSKYALEEFRQNSTIRNYTDNLYLLDILDTHLHIQNQEQLDILDVGSKNWEYAKAEYYFFKAHSKNMCLNGIELDAHRLYSNFYSRSEVAKYHIKKLENTEYIEGDFLKQNKKYDFIIWILPFIKKYPHLQWGLPLEYFKPNEMLKHAHECLKKNGQLLIINQGKEEFEIQKQLCKQLSIEIQESHKIQSSFSNYKMDRYLILSNKKEY